MAIKAIYLDNRVLKSPTTGGELKNLQDTTNLKDYIQSVVDSSDISFTSLNVDTVNEKTSGHGVIVDGVLLKDGGVTIADASNLIFGTTTGTKIGTATSQKLAFWNKTPIVQPTTAISGATNVGGVGTTVKVDDTFGGYTIAKVVAALQAVGILA